MTETKARRQKKETCPKCNRRKVRPMRIDDWSKVHYTLVARRLVPHNYMYKSRGKVCDHCQWLHPDGVMEAKWSNTAYRLIKYHLNDMTWQT